MVKQTTQKIKIFDKQDWLMIALGMIGLFCGWIAWSINGGLLK